MVKRNTGILLAVILGMLLSLTTRAIAVDPPPPPEPDITVTDSVAPIDDLQVPFGDVTVNSSSNQTVTVTNDGNANLEIGNIAQNDPLVAPFSILNDNCSGQTIAPSENCTLTVRFSPTTTSSFSDTFDIPSDDPDENPVTIGVSGTGTPIPVSDITVTDSIGFANDLQMPFGDLTEGLSLDRVVKVTNDGTASLVIGNIAQNDPLVAPFSILNDNCSGQTIAPSGNCTLIVRFSPTTTGLFNDSFDIPSNDPDENPVTVTVSGTGLSSATNNPPSIPQLVYPANGQIDLGTTVTFRWEKSTDPDGNTVTYYLYYCDDQNFIDCTPIEIASLESLENKGIYYAGTSAGLLLFGIVLAGGVRNRRKIVLLFAMIMIAAMLSVSCGGGGGGGGNGDGGNGGGGSTEVTQEVSGLSTGTTYYWKVVVDDGNGGVTESGVRSFTTQ